MKITDFGCLFFLFSSPISHMSADTADPRLDKLNSFCNAPGSPFVYNKQSHLYFIIINQVENGKNIPFRYLIRYCPFTGTILPTGKEAFFEIDETLLNKIKMQLKNIKNLDKVKDILGNPEYECSQTDYFEGQLFYTSLSKTTNICIQKDLQSDTLHVIAIAKAKSQ